ncbi:protein-L-isoaspartate O-methyltransferase [Bradyrhizobium sp. U87765 SZCCT0131]|uniref:protein-L-isoaspartate O-methyltransferase family protein n=1 Tax=unclassified Bradyrhizobium TaxID=2631580 RepID=UPI001BAACCFB|nr:MULTISPECIES: protein-L-isoaspartate O-methyltransferase [unclassified Bradyrhizobium]MBR1220250.1 protein-L-isoaspartate O-methyltransferase [Bradyrhizobium sp. U87765 SZCCT0131]MBR1263294.1 protein-L-isoaspartate O-methyltransferase [Bradyrhizobium sp. U87765 SZCCT0134]MBR1306823.1 protein-L-isoaspartate O-methyltransferase [Bradyrhizobium sp. U87765 SZCCT0110]MBR1323322.1 protein-L-isoaspartate O-methyltransferase [Bradyrhizobium sp. U87765 SZCCT0109]MBR1345777.1 protein-L-isoaspartate O
MTNFASARRKMVDGQVRTNDVTDLRIIDAMLEVPREAFVPDAQRAMAYLDLDIDVGSKRYLIKPVVIAKMLQAADIASSDRALVVGCASGYAAAIAGRLAAEVVATEADPALAATATAALAAVGAGNVTVVAAEAAAGAPDKAPYDVIVLDGATEVAPERLYEQLVMGGRLVGVFATEQPPRVEIVTRSPGDFGNRPLFDAYAPILPGLERPAAFVF